MTEYDYTFKLMMLGDASVGKTSLTLRYISGYFMQDLKLTLGVDFYSKTTLFNSKKVKLQIWDFGGEERFRFLLSQYSKGANGAFFLYDITNPMSLEHLPDWTQIVREDGIVAAKKYNLTSFIELSSKTGENVEKAFDVLTEFLFEDY